MTTHPTSVICNYSAVTTGGVTLLQIDTVGSKERSIVGKVTQTLLFDKKNAGRLIDILRSEFDLS